MKTILFAVQFARFCTEFKIDPSDLSRMIEAARASKRAWENNNPKREWQQADIVEAIADKYGLKVDWPGLWPTIKNADGREDLLPIY